MVYRIITLFVFIAVFCSGAGFLVAGFLGMGIGLLIAALFILYLRYRSTTLVIRLFRAKLNTDKELDNTLDRLANNAKVPKPKLYIIANETPNSFYAGMGVREAVVCITEGVLSLDKDEVEAVIAHELGHIKGRDMMISTAATAIALIISYPAQKLYDGTFRRNPKSRLGRLLSVVMVIFAVPAAMVMRLCISNAMEYRADFNGAFITQKPKKLASAIVKINDLARHNPMSVPAATSQAWIVNPFRDDWFSNLFNTDPPTARRVRRLSDMSHEGLAERTRVWE
jgi:heat shock protein HtpX